MALAGAPDAAHTDYTHEVGYKTAAAKPVVGPASVPPSCGDAFGVPVVAVRLKMSLGNYQRACRPDIGMTFAEKLENLTWAERDMMGRCYLSTPNAET